jgi:hypothetical protein
MEYQNLVRDFATRTLKNLEAVENAIRRDGEAELYEVTQLINSMLGLLVFPEQKYLDRVPRTPVAELRAQGWPVPEMKGTPPHAEDLRDLVRCLRNGISHFNIEFTSDGHQLTGIKIWTCETDAQGKYVKKGGHRVREWEAQFGLQELREIARKFVAMLLDVRA